MGWADYTIKALQEGKRSSCTPHGRSMEPHVLNGQKVFLDPCTAEQAELGRVVLCVVHGQQYLHFVKAKKLEGTTWRCLIANARGHENGWTSQVYGVLSKDQNEAPRPK